VPKNTLSHSKKGATNPWLFVLKGLFMKTSDLRVISNSAQLTAR
jgi:hypothetical protein